MELAGKRVLVLWADSRSQYLRHWLREQGAYSEMSLTTEMGLHCCQRGRYDLLIVDVLAPGEFGWDFVQRLYRELCLSLSVPVLYIGHHRHNLLVKHGLLGTECNYMWVPGSVDSFPRVFGGFLEKLGECSGSLSVDLEESVDEGVEHLGHS